MHPRDVFNSLKYHFLLKQWPKILGKLYPKFHEYKISSKSPLLQTTKGAFQQ